MKNLKKIIGFLLAVTMLVGVIPAFAVDSEKEYYDYGTYVLLGDSVASGYSDLEYFDTEFIRVENSYGAFVADDLGVEYIPMACPSFRTVELRYIFEDDFEADRFLFYSAHDEDVMKARIPEIRQAVADAGLITLGIGGNDWGTFLGWHIYEEMDKQSVSTNFFEMAEEYLREADLDDDTIEALIDIADLTNALPDLVSILPAAFKSGMKNYLENWNYVIEDIYALNPDVELLVIGMCDNTVTSQEDVEKNEKALIKLSISQAIVDYANAPMIEGAEKYGYTFVDTTGTICDEVHPSPVGHRFIADRILEELPDARFPYRDVERKADCYKAVEKMFTTGIMEGTSGTTFSPEDLLTKAQLAEALDKMELSVEISDKLSRGEGVALGDMALTLASTEEDDFFGKVRIIVFAIKLFFSKGADFASDITRGEAAQIIAAYLDI